MRRQLPRRATVLSPSPVDRAQPASVPSGRHDQPAMAVQSRRSRPLAKIADATLASSCGLPSYADILGDLRPRVRSDDKTETAETGWPSFLNHPTARTCRAATNRRRGGVSRPDDIARRLRRDSACARALSSEHIAVATWNAMEKTLILISRARRDGGARPKFDITVVAMAGFASRPSLCQHYRDHGDQFRRRPMPRSSVIRPRSSSPSSAIIPLTARNSTALFWAQRIVFGRTDPIDVEARPARPQWGALRKAPFSFPTALPPE